MSQNFVDQTKQKRSLTMSLFIALLVLLIVWLAVCQPIQAPAAPDVAPDVDRVGFPENYQTDFTLFYEFDRRITRRRV